MLIFTINSERIHIKDCSSEIKDNQEDIKAYVILEGYDYNITVKDSIKTIIPFYNNISIFKWYFKDICAITNKYKVIKNVYNNYENDK